MIELVNEERDRTRLVIEGREITLMNSPCDQTHLDKQGERDHLDERGETEIDMMNERKESTKSPTMLSCESMMWLIKIYGCSSKDRHKTNIL